MGNSSDQEYSRRHFEHMLHGRVRGTYFDLYGKKKVVDGVVTRWSIRYLWDTHMYTKYGRQGTQIHSCEVLMVDGEVICARGLDATWEEA